MSPNTAAAPIFGTARHPFRAAMPARVLRRLPRFEPEVLARIDAAEEPGKMGGEAATSVRRRLIAAQDVKDFLIAYVACFMAVSVFLT